MTITKVIQPFIVDNFRDLISRRFGLSIRERDVDKLREALAHCMEAEKINDPDVLLELLRSDRDEKSPRWEMLIGEIANNESYFFRDQGQFSLLKNFLLPELIRKNLRNRSLKIWSAGCSRGEEAYSIAIVLRETIPDLSQWDILILGTDIDREALEQANKGVYSAWSLRGIDKAIRKMYFTKKGKWWKLAESVKSMVRFSYYNLISDELPELLTTEENVDLIFCRNVFIYLEPSLVPGIIGKFERVLKPGGYLFTAHAEVQKRDYGSLKPRLFPESIVFRKEKIREKKTDRFVLLHQMKNAEKKPPVFFKRSETFRKEQPEIGRKRPSGLSTRAASKRSPFTIDTAEIKNLYMKADYYAVINKIGGKQPGTLDDENLLWLAQSYANVGKDEKALQVCEELIRRNPLQETPYCIQAQICEERGEIKRAMRLLERVIYINSEYICGYLNLAALHEREGNLDKAQQIRRIALELLKKRPETEPVEPYPDMTAGEICAHLEKLLR